MNNNKIIDFELCAAITNAKKSDFQGILYYLIHSTLPDAVCEMKMVFHKRDIPALIENVHKLHGGVAYCGVPRLQNALSDLEKQLKAGDLTQLDTSCQRVFNEMTLLEKEYEKIYGNMSTMKG